MPPNALVTGATGFIGSHLVEFLILRNWKVTCLIRPTSRINALHNFPVVIVRAQWNDHKAIEKAIQNQDYVFHLAARIRSAPKEVYNEANFLFTRSLANACLQKNSNIKRFIYISSISTAGPSAPGQYSDERQIPSPTSEYGRTKLKGEEAIRELWDRLPATIIRPPNVYGPRQQETEMLIKMLSKRVVPLLRGKKKATSLIYVKDLIRGSLEASLSPKTTQQVYYLCNKRGYSWREIILTLKKVMLGESLFLPIPEDAISLFAWITDFFKSTRILKSHFGRRAWHVMIHTPWLFSPLKAEKDFGFRSLYTLEKGLEETVNYFLRQKARRERKAANIKQ